MVDECGVPANTKTKTKTKTKTNTKTKTKTNTTACMYHRSDSIHRSFKVSVLDIDRSSQSSYTKCRCHKLFWFSKARNEAFDIFSSSKDF